MCGSVGMEGEGPIKIMDHGPLCATTKVRPARGGNGRGSLGVLMQLKDSAEIGQGHPAGGRGSRREAQEDRQLVMAQLPSTSMSRVCPGNEGPRGVGERRVEMGPAKARVLVSHLCGG